MAIDFRPFFAWVNSSDLAFSEAFVRNDETVLGYHLGQKEGEFATLELTIKSPTGIALLSAARKQWGWFSYASGTDIIPRFFGRLIGVQTVNSDDGPIAILNFTAEPVDFIDQKKTIANGRRNLPYYDRAFIDEQSWDDDDIVLEAYPERYYIDPVTHVVDTSNELIGEDGVEIFNEADTLYGGFTQELTDRPATSVDVKADVIWTQQGQGQVDLTNYMVANWTGAINGAITSYTFQASSWPSIGSSVGDGWKVASSSCFSRYDTAVRSAPYNTGIVINWGDWGGGSTNTQVQASGSDDVISLPPGSIFFGGIVTDENTIPRYDDDGELVSWNYSSSWTTAALPLNHLIPTLIAEYNAQRQCTEKVSFTLVADIQPVVGEAAQAQALEPINLQTSNLSDIIGAETDAETPIVDARRRSYICTDRGQQSLQYMIARGQTALLRSSRCVEIEFVPTDFARMADITLRKNARIYRGDIPGGVAEGKIIEFSEGLSQDSGSLEWRVRIGCTVGRGGEITQVAGENTYIEDYIDDGHFEESGGTELFDSSVGYTPPLFAPNDDGLDFIGGFSAADSFDEGLTITNPWPTQEAAILSLGVLFQPLVGQANVDARTNIVNAKLDTIKTVVNFKLKSMSREFETDVPIDVTELKIPTMINLEAV